MEFWDSISKGMDKLANKIDSINESRHVRDYDTEFSVLDKDYCWEDLDYSGDLTLQRHIVTGDCRIVNHYGETLHRGKQPDLEQIMIQTAAADAANRNMQGAQISGTIPAYSTEYTPVQAQYGDIIGVVRRGGTYTHYGIYVSDTCIVHYGIPAGKTLPQAEIHCTNLAYFLKDDSEYFILDFPKPYQPPVLLGNEGKVPHAESVSEELARRLQQTYGYHLYTPEETVARARSRIGETNYHLLTNNCEHFAIWCKTGVNESLQVMGMLQLLTGSAGWQFRRPATR